MRSNGSPTGKNQASEEDIRRLAQLNGLQVSDADLSEVTFRFRALLSAARRLDEIDLTGVEPLAVMPEREAI